MPEMNRGFVIREVDFLCVQADRSVKCIYTLLIQFVDSGAKASDFFVCLQRSSRVFNLTLLKRRYRKMEATKINNAKAVNSALTFSVSLAKRVHLLERLKTWYIKNVLTAKQDMT